MNKIDSINEQAPCREGHSACLFVAHSVNEIISRGERRDG